MDIQRDEAFEEAYSKICKPIIARPYPRNEKGEYFYKEIHEAHLMWQAAQAQTVPEGFILVPQEPTELFKEHLKNHLFDLWAGDHGCDWDGFVSVDAINHNTIWKMMIEAQEQNHEYS